MGVVGIHLMAVDNSWQYRPLESPAYIHIEDDAGDAVGTLRRILRTSLSSFAASLLTRSFQSRLERVCSRGEDSQGPQGANRFYKPSKRLVPASSPGDRASGSKPGCELLLPQLGSFRRYYERECGEMKLAPYDRIGMCCQARR
jgi:hypothetical protein